MKPDARPGVDADSLRTRPVQIPEVWIRFFVAILGLGMAFAAALFSTVSRAVAQAT